MQKVYDFLTSSEYALNECEISGGGLLSVLTYANLLYFLPFFSDTSSLIPSVVAGVTTGGAAVSSNKLSLNTGSNTYIDYTGVTGLGGQTGCVRLKFTPQWSGTPSVPQYLFNISNAQNDNKGFIQIVSNDIGGLHAFVFSSVPTQIANAGGSWVPVAGQEYELEFDWDVTTGASRLFVDGVQLGATDTGTGNRGGVGNFIRIGDSVQLTGNVPQFKIREATVYSTPQHTSGYVAPTAFLKKYDSGTIETNNSIMAKDLLTLSLEETILGSDTIKIGLSVDAVLKYWNGSAWADSDGSAAQLNTLAVISTNMGDLLTGHSEVKLFFRLTSANGTTSPLITEATINYDFGATEPSAPSVCTVFGFILDLIREPIVNAQIKFTPSVTSTLYLEAAGHIVLTEPITVVSDSDGYFETPLLISTAFEGMTVKYDVEIKHTTQQRFTSTGKLNITVPDSETVNITDLLTAV